MTEPERIHAAVLDPRYCGLILDGVKAVESRLSINRVVPFGVVRPGERIYFKPRGGPYAVTATVSAVHSYQELSTRDFDLLRRIWNARVLAPRSYWVQRGRARYATLIELVDPQSVSFGPRTPHFYGRGWVTLPASQDVYPACLKERTRLRSAG